MPGLPGRGARTARGDSALAHAAPRGRAHHAWATEALPAPRTGLMNQSAARVREHHVPLQLTAEEAPRPPPGLRGHRSRALPLPGVREHQGLAPWVGYTTPLLPPPLESEQKSLLCFDILLPPQRGLR